MFDLTRLVRLGTLLFRTKDDGRWHILKRSSVSMISRHVIASPLCVSDRPVPKIKGLLAEESRRNESKAGLKYRPLPSCIDPWSSSCTSRWAARFRSESRSDWANDAKHNDTKGRRDNESGTVWFWQRAKMVRASDMRSLSLGLIWLLSISW